MSMSASYEDNKQPLESSVDNLHFLAYLTCYLNQHNKRSSLLALLAASAGIA